jgi:O-succinylbenzoic acid--CoA ligase
MTTILPGSLLRNADNYPDRLAIRCEDVSWSFAELARQATCLARQFAAAGIGKQQRVALLAHNSLSYVTTVHALTLLGAILVPLNTRLTLAELCWQLRDVQAAHLLYDQSHEDLARHIQHHIPDLPQHLLYEDAGTISIEGIEPASDFIPETTINLDTIQAIMYTSGTTGRPKGVLITYGMQWWNATGSSLNLGHYPHDRWLACLPLFHIGGLAILFRSVINGTGVILHRRFDARAINRSIHEDHVTIISVVAVMLQRMLTTLATEQDQHGYPAHLRCVLLGGGPAPRPLLEACAAQAIPVVQTYGLTEACSQAVTLAPDDALRKLGSAGRPLLPVQLRIMDNDQVASPGTPGIICLKGPSITPGYVNHDTATTLHDGWLSTGDIGYLDDEGYLYVLDRRNDLIISGGENIYPAEVEAILLAHPAVAEAGVCGQPDPQWGQIPIAFVCPSPDHSITISALHTYLTNHLARYKCPHMIYVVEQLPRNSSGKLLRRALPSLIKHAIASAARNASSPP